MTLELRRYRDADFEPVLELTRQTIRTSYAEVYPPRVVEFFLDYHAPENIVSDATQGHTLVVFDGDELVGTGTRVDTTVRRVFVRADRHRHGLGHRIMAELEAAAQDAGVARVDLSASLPAKQFYLDLGYEIVSEEDYEVAPGEHLEYYEMAKELVR